MKVLIVDDEIHVIKAIKLLVPWKELGITDVLEASDPKIAINIIEQYHPEILISDMVMQDLSGIDLMDYVYRSHIHPKIIIISGYDNFEYVRGSMQLGGVDYILKPINKVQLINAIKKAGSAWLQEESLQNTVLFQKKQIEIMTDSYKETLLKKVLNSNYTQNDYEELVHTCFEMKEQDYIAFAYCSLGNFVSIQEHLNEINALRNKITMFITSKHAFLVSGEDLGEIQLFFPILTQTVIKDFEEFLCSCQKGFPFRINMGISYAMLSPTNIQTIAEQAKEAYYDMDLSSSLPILLDYNKITDVSYNKPPLHETDEINLMSAMLTGDKVYMEKSIHTWLDDQLSDTPLLLGIVNELLKDTYTIRDYWIVTLEKRYNIDLHQYITHSMPLNTFLDSSLLLTRAYLETKLCENMDSFYHDCILSNIQCSDIMHQIVLYIELNYDKPFNQTECALLFHINKDYLSRKFKQIFHVNMITYINNKRIEEAKRLLSDSNMKVNQVSQQVGFDDEKYFSRLFKKTTGMSPADYQKQIVNRIPYRQK